MMANVMLSVVMAIMATMSTTMLGIGQGNALLPMITFMAAATSVVFTDALGWFRLNRVIANLAMLLAAFFSLYGFLESNSHQQLVAIAHLLIYVQLVLLFQEKNRRVYGQLAMFSLLQVVVASLLNSSLEFGMLLASYMVVALIGFVLFFVFREVSRVGMVTPRRSWFGTKVSKSSTLDALSDGLPVLEVVDTGAALNRKIVSRKIVFPIVAMVSATIVFTTVFFYTTPRTGGANWQSGGGGRTLVGFSPEVSFDEMGQLLLSDARVMRVSFTNIRNGEPYTVIGQPYFRGSALTHYLTFRGRGHWQQEVESSISAGLTLASPPGTRDLVRQDILLDPTGSDLLFSMSPAYAIAQTPEEIRIGPRTRRLFRSGATPGTLRNEYRYAIVTTAFLFGAQNRVIPHSNQLRTEQEKSSMERANLRLRFIDNREAFPGLIALADQIVNEKCPDGDSFERARELEAYLQDDKRFQYTLNFDEVNARRQAGVDPIEDFVTNHRMGHCEYFASALTLMLRSQNIPARLVVGYRGGEFNYVGNYYVVRQRNAHAWVEAHVKPEEIPPGAIYREEQHAGGGWLRLDPTPVARNQNENPLAQVNLLDRATKSLDYARWLWNDYVFRLTAERQKRAIFDPLAIDHKLSLARLSNAETWKGLAERLTGTDWSDLANAKFSCAGDWRPSCPASPLIWGIVSSGIGGPCCV